MMNLLRHSCIVFMVLILLGENSFSQVSKDVKKEKSNYSVSYSGKWIWQADDGPENTWACFRKSFQLADIPESANTTIAVDSKYWLWVNDELIVFEGGLKQGPTPDDSYCDLIDLASYFKEGENTIAIMVWYFGKQGFSHIDRGKGGLFFESDLSSSLLVSDNTWKVKIHPSYENTSGDEEPNFRLPESNVRFNAQKDDMGDWYVSGYDDSSWDNAVEKGTPPEAPWGELWVRPIPQWKNSGLTAYTDISVSLPFTTSEITVVEAKMPYNAHLTPYLDIDAPAGLVIDIRTDTYEPSPHVYSLRAEYVTKEGTQQYESPGWINGHVVYYTIPAGVTVNDLLYRETGYNTEFAGSFTCNDNFFNVLWTKAQRALYVNMRDTYMDCPDRERGLWWGDAVLEIGEAFYALDRKADMLSKKCISNMVKWQKEDHTLFAPTPAGNWFRELPAQTLASVGPYGFWYYYMYSGDTAAIEDAYPHIKTYLTLWTLDEDGLVIHRGGDWNYDGPWAWTDWGSNIDVRVIDNAWYYMALKTAKDMAVLTGNQLDTVIYNENLSSIEENFNRVFWQGLYYKDPNFDGHVDDRANGLAVLTGLAEREKWPGIFNVLETFRNSSPYMEKYVLEALYLMGYDDYALERMKLEDRYAPMVNSNNTTLYEVFGNGGTINHGWSGGPLTLLSQYAAGVAPETPGFKSYHVFPQEGSLTSIHSVTPSCKGNIEVSIEKTATNYDLTVNSPAETNAIVGMPISPNEGKAVSNITINGSTAWQNGSATGNIDGVTYIGENENYYLFSLDPGEYLLSATIIDSETGIADSRSFERLKIYPVPASKMLTVSNDTTLKQVDIFSSNGEKVKSQNGSSHSLDIDVSSLLTGLYFVQVTNCNNDSITRKILINP